MWSEKLFTFTEADVRLTGYDVNVRLIWWIDFLFNGLDVTFHTLWIIKSLLTKKNWVSTHALNNVRHVYFLKRNSGSWRALLQFWLTVSDPLFSLTEETAVRESVCSPPHWFIHWRFLNLLQYPHWFTLQLEVELGIQIFINKFSTSDGRGNGKSWC